MKDHRIIVMPEPSQKPAGEALSSVLLKRLKKALVELQRTIKRQEQLLTSCNDLLRRMSQHDDLVAPEDREKSVGDLVQYELPFLDRNLIHPLDAAKASRITLRFYM